MARKGIYKVPVLGDGAVGKTSIIRRFISAKFAADYRLTIGIDIMTKDIEVDGQFLSTLSLWDTAGQERFHL
jgi:small GTP-binding protein